MNEQGLTKTSAVKASQTQTQASTQELPRGEAIITLDRTHATDGTTTPIPANGEVTSTSAPARLNVYAPEVARRQLWREASNGLARIKMDPTVAQGRPVIRNTRISVAQVLGMLADYGTAEKVVEQFDGILESDDIKAVLEFTARLAR